MNEPSPQPELNHRQQAEQAAIRLAVDRLGRVPDLGARCHSLGLPDPERTGGAIRLPAWGAMMELRPPDFQAASLATGKPAKPTDRLLMLHYLLCEAVVQPAHAWITFRDFPGGAFYWQPFLSRSIQPLTHRIGNDLPLLTDRLNRWGGREEGSPPDGLSARVQAIGMVDLLLVYRRGDDEFPPTADLLYDACARRIFCAEDAAALGSRLCLGLLQP